VVLFVFQNFRVVTPGWQLGGGKKEDKDKETTCGDRRHLGDSEGQSMGGTGREHDGGWCMGAL